MSVVPIYERALLMSYLFVCLSFDFMVYVFSCNVPWPVTGYGYTRVESLFVDTSGR